MIEAGDLVKIDPRFLNENDSGIGFVYEVYQDFDDESKNGVSIITKEGKDLGGFSYREQIEYLVKERSTGLSYQFVNVIKLANDYREGLFKVYFEL